DDRKKERRRPDRAGAGRLRALCTGSDYGVRGERRRRGGGVAGGGTCGGCRSADGSPPRYGRGSGGNRPAGTFGNDRVCARIGHHRGPAGRKGGGRADLLLNGASGYVATMILRKRV